MKHLKYLSYVARHKWFVLCACFRRGLYWQGIVHDWSKFRPGEWLPYANFFYGRIADRDREAAIRQLGHDPFPADEKYRAAFDAAWLKHQHRNPHHWQHWILREDNGATFPIEMPLRYAREMVCDWEGAGRAITGRSGETRSWYEKNQSKMQLHPKTRAVVEWELSR